MKKTMITVSGIILVVGIFYEGSAYKYTAFKQVPEDKIQVTASRLNVRSGPGTEYKQAGIVKKGQVLDVIGSLDNWYVVHLPDNTVGVVSSQYTKVYSINNVLEEVDDTGDESIAALFNLINGVRMENNLPVYVLDEDLSRAAQLKADDMVRNNYLSHDSKTYGSPFQMLKALGIVYKRAGENIAANRSVEKAHKHIMDSPSHKMNVLSKNFDKIGIGIANNEKYGKVIVELFIES